MTPEESNIVKQMGAVIRLLDHDSQYSQFWLNDENYIIALNNPHLYTDSDFD